MGKLTYERGTRATWLHNYKVNGVDSTSGVTLLFTVKPTEYDTDAADNTAIVKKTITMGGSSNAITIMEADVADTVKPGNYHYDIKIVDSLMGTILVDKGQFVLQATPTNRLS